MSDFNGLSYRARSTFPATPKEELNCTEKIHVAIAGQKTCKCFKMQLCDYCGELRDTHTIRHVMTSMICEKCWTTKGASELKIDDNSPHMIKGPDGGFGSVGIITKCDLVEKEMINHPDHYGGKDNPYEAIKVIEAWELGFCLGNTIKYIARCGKKDATTQELKKAAWYLDREIKNRESKK